MNALACAQIDRCFGFDTAVEESQRALLAAKVEATSAYKGIGLVKLMGRQSGFIAMQASMASGACCTHHFPLTSLLFLRAHSLILVLHFDPTMIKLEPAAGACRK